MGRRGHNEGSIYKRDDGRWVGAITLDERRRKAFYGKTRAEVAKKVAEALRDKEKGLPIVPERQTVGQFLTQWLEVARTSVRPSTYTAYETYVRRHAFPALGKIKLARLSPQHIQALYAKKLQEGLSPTSVVQLHRILHRSLKQAVR